MEKKYIIGGIIIYLLLILIGIGLLTQNNSIDKKMQQQYELGYVEGFNSCVLSILDSKQ